MKVRLEPEAVSDFESIHAWIARDSVDMANFVVRRILANIERLGVFPRMGREGHDEGTREWPVPGLPYIVVYELDNAADELVVIGVFHAARDRH